MLGYRDYFELRKCARKQSRRILRYCLSKGKAISTTERETSRLPHFFLDSRLTDGGKFGSLTRRPPFTYQEDSWY
jgi:hypothetical protein